MASVIDIKDTVGHQIGFVMVLMSPQSLLKTPFDESTFVMWNEIMKKTALLKDEGVSKSNEEHQEREKGVKNFPPQQVAEARTSLWAPRVFSS